MEQHQEVKGTLLVQRPGRFRMDSDVQVVVSDGKTAWNYAPANAQVLVSDYSAIENDRSYEKLLFDLILLGGYDESYTPVYVGEKKYSARPVMWSICPEKKKILTSIPFACGSTNASIWCAKWNIAISTRM